MLVLYILCLKFAQMRKEIKKNVYMEKIKSLFLLSKLAKQSLETDSKIQSVCSSFIDIKGSMFLGRGYSFPIALEGALKTKRIILCSC